MYTQEPFVNSVNTPPCIARVRPISGQRQNGFVPKCGNISVRFRPTGSQTIPASTWMRVSGDDPNNYFEWRVNPKSKGRAFWCWFYIRTLPKMLPTVIYEGSHVDVARLLLTKGDAGAFLYGACRLRWTDYRTKKRCMPPVNRERFISVTPSWFIRHRPTEETILSLWPNRLCLLRGELNIAGSDVDHSPVERAIRFWHWINNPVCSEIERK